MAFFAQGNDQGKIHTVLQSPNSVIVKVASEDARLIGTVYDEATGTFTGYKIVLTTDKNQITADGVDTATITATVYTWDDQVATDFADPIIFDYEGNPDPPESVVPIAGVASIPFASNEPGMTNFFTANEGISIISNGQITIEAVSA